MATGVPELYNISNTQKMNSKRTLLLTFYPR